MTYFYCRPRRGRAQLGMSAARGRKQPRAVAGRNLEAPGRAARGPQTALSQLLGEFPKVATDRGLLTAYLYFFQSRNPTQKSVQVYRERIRYLIRLANDRHKSVMELTRDDIQAWALSHMGQLAPISINGRLKVWRQFYDWVVSTGECPAGWQNPVTAIPRLKEPKKQHRLITPDEYSAAIRTYNQRTFTGLRNICIMLVAWDCMLRKTELLTIRTGDIIIEPSRRLLRVVGKGRKEAWLPFSHRTASRLLLYMERRRDIDGALLFCSSKGTPIDERHGHRIFANAGKKLSPPVDIHPHLVRRSSATHYWRLTDNIYLVSHILRHSSVKVTEQYVQAGQEEVVRAYENVTPASALRV